MTVDTFGPGLVSTVGETHRKQRKLLTPAFSNKNLQQMTPVFYEVVSRLCSGVRALVSKGTAEVDMGGYMSRVALEIMAYLPSIYALSDYFYLYAILRPLIPETLRRPLMDLIPSRRVRRMTQTIDAIHAHAVEAFYEKKRAADADDLQDAPVTLNKTRDLMTILLSANTGASEEDALPDEELIAQLSTIIFAATDTTANALSLVLECLTRRPDAQHKLREEVLGAKRNYDGRELPYDELLALPYLDAVYKETLRVHAPLPLRFRETRASVVLPLSKPVRGVDGTLISSIFVPKDTLVFIPVQAVNTSPDLWGPDAAEWRPERWLEPLPLALAEAKIPGVYPNMMTFWGGGRGCIGFKFSELSMKVVLSELIAACRFEKTDKPVVWNIGEVIYPTVGFEAVFSPLQRKLLNPVFSPKNLRLVTPVFYEVTHRLTKAIKSQISSNGPEVDVAQYMARAALELIGQAALGHCFDPLTEEASNPYAEALKCYIPALTACNHFIQLYRFTRPLVPTVLRRPLMNLIPSRCLKELLHTVDTMHENALRIYKEKKAAVESTAKGRHEDAKAKDLATLLLRANAGASAEDMLPEEELIAQLSILVFAATDTTSNALTLILECLAKHPEAQDRLRAELLEAKHRHEGDNIPYDELMALPYLDAVCAETLRVHVPAPIRLREAQVDTVLPLSKPIQGKDGTPVNSVPVPKGTLVYIAVQASNVNANLWGADAHKWRPERWLEPLPDTITNAKIPGVYSNLMTFWGGGRSCIGFKFAQLEMKVVLAELLSTFKFETTDTPIIWNLGEVIHPTVGKDSWQPAYPMKVALLKRC